MQMLKRFPVILVLSVLALISPVWSQSKEDCEACHSDPDLTAVRQGRTVSMYVDFKFYAESVHRSQDCFSCHMDAEVDEFPYP